MSRIHRRVIQSQWHRTGIAALLLCFRVLTHPFPGSILFVLALINFVEAESASVLARSKPEVLFASVPLLAHFEPMLHFAVIYGSQSTYNVSLLASESVFKDFSFKERSKWRLRGKHSTHHMVELPKFRLYDDFTTRSDFYKAIGPDLPFVPEPILLSLAHQHSMFTTLLMEYDVDGNNVRDVPSVIVADRFAFGAIAFAKKFNIKLALYSPQSLLSMDNPDAAVRPPFQIPRSQWPILCNVVWNLFSRMDYANLARIILGEIAHFHSTVGVENNVHRLYNESLILSQTVRNGLDTPRTISLPHFHHLGVGLSNPETKELALRKRFFKWASEEQVRRRFGLGGNRVCLVTLGKRAFDVLQINRALKVPTVLISPYEELPLQLEMQRRLFSNTSIPLVWHAVVSGEYHEVIRLLLKLTAPVLVLPEKLLQKEVGFLLKERRLGGIAEGSNISKDVRKLLQSKEIGANAVKTSKELRMAAQRRGFKHASLLIDHLIVGETILGYNKCKLEERQAELAFQGKVLFLLLVFLVAVVMRLLAQTLVFALEGEETQRLTDNFAEQGTIKSH